MFGNTYKKNRKKISNRKRKKAATTLSSHENNSPRIGNQYKIKEGNKKNPFGCFTEMEDNLKNELF